MRSVPLITFDPSLRQLVCSSHALSLLEELHDFRSISIIGPYRSGKSTLLNLLLQEKQIFGVGCTTNAHTKGIWMSVGKLNGQQTLIIDCEGLGSLQGDISNDYKLCLATMMLSSILLYNSVGVIDEGTISQFQFLLQIAKRIQRKQHQFPELVWLVRDFGLQLTDCKDNPITQDQYLQLALAQKNYESNSQKASIRRLIKQYFPKRSCCTFVRPMTSEHYLQNISEAPRKQLRKQFNQKIIQLRHKLQANRIQKITQGKNYVKLIKHVIDEINSQKFPDVRPLFELMRKEQLHCQMMTCLNQLEIKSSSIKLPNEQKIILKQLRSQKQIILKNLKIQLRQHQDLMQQLKGRLLDLKQRIIHKNQDQSQKKIKAFLQTQSSQISKRITSNYYLDFDSFERDVKIFMKFCFTTLASYPNRDLLIQNYVLLKAVELCRRLNMNKQSDINKLKESQLQFSRSVQAQCQQQKQQTHQKIKQLKRQIEDHKRNNDNLNFRLQIAEAQLQQNNSKHHEVELQLKKSLTLQKGQTQQAKALFQQKTKLQEERTEMYRTRLQELQSYRKKQSAQLQLRMNEIIGDRQQQIALLKQRLNQSKQTLQSMLSEKNKYLRESLQKQNSVNLLEQQLLKSREQTKQLQDRLQAQHLEFVKQTMTHSENKHVQLQLQMQLREKQQSLQMICKLYREKQDFYHKQFKSLQRIIQQTRNQYQLTIADCQSKIALLQTFLSHNKRPLPPQSSRISLKNQEKDSSFMLLEELQIPNSRNNIVAQKCPVPNSKQQKKVTKGVIRDTPKWSEGKQNKLVKRRHF